MIAGDFAFLCGMAGIVCAGLIFLVILINL